MYLLPGTRYVCLLVFVLDYNVSCKMYSYHDILCKYHTMYFVMLLLFVLDNNVILSRFITSHISYKQVFCRYTNNVQVIM